MGYNFDLRATEPEPGRSPKPRRDEVEWIPLQNHPVFSYSPVHDSIAARAPRNLLAWDGASRLHFWDSDKLCLHRISIRLGENPNSVTAASPSKVSSLSLIFFLNFIFFDSVWLLRKLKNKKAIALELYSAELSVISFLDLI